MKICDLMYLLVFFVIFVVCVVRVNLMVDVKKFFVEEGIVIIFCLIIYLCSLFGFMCYGLGLESLVVIIVGKIWFCC